MEKDLLIEKIMAQYFTEPQAFSVKILQSGHINDTFKISFEDQSFLLQRINQEVFKKPYQVQVNYQFVYQHLKGKLDSLKLPALILTNKQNTLVEYPKNHFWRLVQFLENSHSILNVETLEQVESAAQAMGRFLAALNQDPPTQVKDTIPNFHHFFKREIQLKAIVKKDAFDRLKKVKSELSYLEAQKKKLIDYSKAKLPFRLVHNDPKISNLLYDQEQKVLAVIDWDTLMPGFLATDFGDMIRSMAATANEEEADLDKVNLNLPFLEAICRSLLAPLAPIMSPEEVASLHGGPSYIVLEQMLRFLSDYLNGDQYYKTHYPDQNLVRARNQMKLHQEIVAHEAKIKQLVQAALS